VQLRGLYETRVGILMNLRSDAVPSDPIALHSLKLLYKFVRTLGKFFRRVQQADSVRFVKLPVCDDLVLYYWEKVVQANSSAELIEGMLRERCGSRSLISLILRLRSCCVPRSHSRGWDGPVQGESRSMVPIAESKDRSYLKWVPEPLAMSFLLAYPQPFPRILWRPLLHSSLLVLCRLIRTTSKAGWRTQRNGSTPRTRMTSSGSLNYG